MYRYYGTNIKVKGLPKWHIKLLLKYDRIYKVSIKRLLRFKDKQTDVTK